MSAAPVSFVVATKLSANQLPCPARARAKERREPEPTSPDATSEPDSLGTSELCWLRAQAAKRARPGPRAGAEAVRV